MRDLADSHASEKDQGEMSKTFLEENRNLRQSHAAAMFGVRGNPALRQHYYPTGLPSLDAALGGGLAPGLICLGGVSGLGKTTLAMQMASCLAGMGEQIIVFSLEMSSIALTGKEVSRQTYLATPNHEFAQTLGSLMDVDAMNGISDEGWSVVEDAVRKTEAAGENVTIVEKLGARPSASEIDDYVSEFVNAYDRKPVVIVDYLQILGSPSGMSRATDKQVVDSNLSILHGLAHRYMIPVILISSLNRGGYESPVKFSSFKESGGIEYTCDTILGLQLTGIGRSNFDLDKAVNECPRKVDILVLKQRFGAAGNKVACNFYAPYNYFEDAAAVRKAPAHEVNGRKHEHSDDASVARTKASSGSNGKTGTKPTVVV